MTLRGSTLRGSRHAAWGLVVGLLCSTMIPAGAPAQETPRPPGAQPRGAAPARRLTPADSAAMDAVRRLVGARERARRDCVQRLRQQAAAAAATDRRSRSPLEGDGPFYGYTWVFVADIAAGALGLWLFAWLRKRNAGGLTSVAASLWLLAGALLGAIVFVPVFMLNGMLSIAFSPTPPWLLFFVSLLAILWVVASIGQITTRRRRRR